MTLTVCLFICISVLVTGVFGWEDVAKLKLYLETAVMIPDEETKERMDDPRLQIDAMKTAYVAKI